MKDFTLKAKEVEAAGIQEKLEKAKSVVFLDYRGLTVSEVTTLRNKMRAAGVEYKVLKNTMVRRAAADAGAEELGEILEGPTAVAFGYDDPVVPAKILTDYIKEVKKTEIKGGLLGNKRLSAAEVNALADMPSKEELLAKMLGSLNAPVTGFVMVLSGVLRSLLYALNAVKEAKENQ